MSDPRKDACQATPHADLITQIMDSRVAKNEREWAAAREIERLRTNYDLLSDDYKQLLIDNERLQNKLANLDYY